MNTIVVLLSLNVLFFSLTAFAHAEDLIISGNSEGSKNSITVSKSSKSSVIQLNETSIENSVKINSISTENTTSTDSENFEKSVTVKTIHEEIRVENQVTNTDVPTNNEDIVELETLTGQDEEISSVTNIYGEQSIPPLENNLEKKIDIESTQTHEISNPLPIKIEDSISKNILSFDKSVQTQALAIECNCANEPPVPPLVPQKENIPPLPTQPVSPSTSTGVIGSTIQGVSTLFKDIILGMSVINISFPLSGNNSLFIMMLANSLMFFWGRYLRLRSGRSPGIIHISE